MSDLAMSGCWFVVYCWMIVVYAWRKEQLLCMYIRFLFMDRRGCMFGGLICFGELVYLGDRTAYMFRDRTGCLLGRTTCMLGRIEQLVC